jgi:hypothetical protein
VPAVEVFCEVGEHDACPHRNVGGIRLVGRSRGPFVDLCACPCHDGCPVSGQVSDASWEARCTCPGGAEYRRVLAASRAEREERTARRKEAMAAAQARADAGEPFDEALAEELHRRDVDLPDGVRAHVARMRRASRAPRGTRSVLGLAALARGGFDAVRAFRSALDRTDDDDG